MNDEAILQGKTCKRVHLCVPPLPLSTKQNAIFRTEKSFDALFPHTTETNCKKKIFFGGRWMKEDVCRAGWGCGGLCVQLFLIISLFCLVFAYVANENGLTGALKWRPKPIITD